MPREIVGLRNTPFIIPARLAIACKKASALSAALAGACACGVSWNATVERPCPAKLVVSPVLGTMNPRRMGRLLMAHTAGTLQTFAPSSTLATVCLAALVAEQMKSPLTAVCGEKVVVV